MSTVLNARQDFQQPTAEELLARARALAPIIAARVEQASRQRDLPPETIAELREAGLFKLFLSSEWGGYQSDPRLFFQIQNIIAEACGSTAWVYGVLSVQALVVSLFDRRAQEEVWGDGQFAFSSSSYQPVGKVTRVDGGFRLSGRWSFSSGSSFAKWVTVGAIVPPTESAPREMRLFLVPRDNYTLVDTWHTFGLRGTGSNDIEIKDAFVPEYRTLKPDMGVVPKNPPPGKTPNLYNLPWMYVFTGSISNLGVGIAKGALKSFCDIAQKRISATKGTVAKDDPPVIAGAARARAEIAAIESMFPRHVARMMECLNNRETMTQEEGLAIRVELSSALRRMAAVVDELNLLLGGRAIRLDSPITQPWLDIMAARSHPGNDAASTATQLGKRLIDPPPA